MSQELIVAWQQYHQTPSAEVFVDEARSQPSAINITFSLENANATCRLSYDRYPSLAGLKVPVQVYLGYGPHQVIAFTGESENTQRSIAPHAYDLVSYGPIKRMRYQYGGEDVPFLDQTDKQIIEQLVALSGLTQVSIDGREIVLGTLQPIWLRDGQAPWSLANRLLQDWGYKLFDTPDGTVRSRRVSGIPATDPVYEFRQGIMGYSFARPRSITTIHNRVVVEGLPQGSFIPSYNLQAASPWIPTPPTYITLTHSSDLLETIEQCQEVAERLMAEHNHISEEMTIVVPGNPLLIPGMTVAVWVDKFDFEGFVNYFVIQVSHGFDSGGFTTQLVLRGGLGAPGEPGDPPGTGEDPPPLEEPGPPEPAVSWVLSREGFLPSGGEVANVPVDAPVRVRYYTFNGDALGSYDPTLPLTETLTYSWSNNKNGDVGTERFYGTHFTKDQMEVDANCTVTLTVTSINGARSLTIPLTANDAQIRVLYAIRGGLIVASKDGGESWDEWTVQAPPEDDTPIMTYLPACPSAIPGPYGRHDGIMSFAPMGETSSFKLPLARHNDFDVVEMRWTGPDPDPASPYDGGCKYCQIRTEAVALQQDMKCSAGEWLPFFTNVQPGFVSEITYPDAFVIFFNSPFHHGTWEIRYGHMEIPPGPDTPVISTPEIAGGNFSLFGSQTGHLFKLEMDDAGEWIAPYIVTDFINPDPGQLDIDLPASEVVAPTITAIWINEVNQDRWTVGFGSGLIYRTEDAGGTWRRINQSMIDNGLIGHHAGWMRIRHIIESALHPGQYRVAMEGYVFKTDNDFATYYRVSFNTPTSDGIAWQVALSPFTNYAAYQNTDGRVVSEVDGSLIALPALPAGDPPGGYVWQNGPQDLSRVITMATHHIRADELWAVTQMGHFLRKLAGATTFTLVGTIPDATTWHVDLTSADHWHGLERGIRDGTAFLTLYLAGIGGIHKTWNGGVTWRKMLQEDYEAIGEENGDFAIDVTPELPRRTVTHIGYGSPQWA